MNTKRILAALVVAAVAGGGGLLAGHWVTGGSGGVADAAASSQPGAVSQLFGAQVTSPDGKPESLAGLKGKPLVVNFWASWCGPCVKEMPELSALQREYAKKGIQFVGLGVDSNANISAFLKKVPVSYPIYVTGFGGADLARAFGNNAGGLPYTIVIDANGVVRSTKLGEIKPDELRHTLDSL